jgi:hypothetical protein
MTGGRVVCAIPSWVYDPGLGPQCGGGTRGRFTAAASGAGADTWLATTDADSGGFTKLAGTPANPSWYRERMVSWGRCGLDWQHHSRVTRLSYERLYNGGDRSVHGHIHGANLGMRSRLVATQRQIVWDTQNPVRTSDRRDCRMRGGFGDYLLRLAEAPSPNTISHRGALVRRADSDRDAGRSDREPSATRA